MSASEEGWDLSVAGHSAQSREGKRGGHGGGRLKPACILQLDRSLHSKPVSCSAGVCDCVGYWFGGQRRTSPRVSVFNQAQKVRYLILLCTDTRNPLDNSLRRHWITTTTPDASRRLIYQHFSLFEFASSSHNHVVDLSVPSPVGRMVSSVCTEDSLERLQDR